MAYRFIPPLVLIKEKIKLVGQKINYFGLPTTINVHVLRYDVNRNETVYFQHPADVEWKINGYI